MPFSSLRSTPVVVAFSLVVLAAVPTASAQQPPPFPFANPEQFFQQFFGADSAADREAIAKVEVSAREEQQIGSRGVEPYLADLKQRGVEVQSRGTDVDYLQKLVGTLRPHMQHAARYRTIRIYVAESKETDARSFAGGTLFFYRGMLDFADSEAALVGVLGHELAHLDRGHQLYDAKRMKLAQRTFSGGNGFSPDEFFRSGAMLMKSFMRPFRPEEEAEADEDGARWAYAAGYDPREMAALFLRMQERDRDKPNGMPAFLRTHPFHIDRYQAVLSLYDELQRQNPQPKLYIGRENLARRIPRSVKAFEE